MTKEAFALCLMVLTIITSDFLNGMLLHKSQFCAIDLFLDSKRGLDSNKRPMNYKNGINYNFFLKCTQAKLYYS